MGDVLSFELEARRLLKLSKDAADSLMRGGINPLLEYVEAKREFRKKFADESSIMAIRDPNERNNLKRLLRGETPVDRIINAMGGTSNTDTQYEFDELSELASDLFYSWFCGEDYVEAMINIDRALLENPPPPAWENIFAEARSCLAFQQYRATVMVCRLLLERCVVTVLESRGQTFTDGYGNVKYRSCFRDIADKNPKKRQELLDLYDDISRVVHGTIKVGKTEAREFIRRTVLAVEFMAAKIPK